MSFQNNFFSENEKIDGFIQEIQLNIKSYNITFEWIPYNQFNEIKEISENSIATVYSAIWKNGPLYHDINNIKYKRESDIKVALKCLHNSQGFTNELLNEVRKSFMNLIYFQ